MTAPDARLRDAAVSAVIAASHVCRTVQARLVEGSALEKGDKSPVTVADFAAQAVVSHALAKAFPDIPLVGEEDADELRKPENAHLEEQVLAAVAQVTPGLSEEDVLAAIDRGVHEGGSTGRFWTLDPIDGTKGFLRLDQYAVALALIEDGGPVLGVLGCPNLPLHAGDTDGVRGCIFFAARGQGATQFALDDGTSVAIEVDAVAEPAGARFCESVEKKHTNQSHSAMVAERLGITAEPFRIDSQCKYAAVARGDASVYLRLPTRKDYVERIWDHAGGWMVITEAGGQVTDVFGEPLDFGQGRGLEKNKGVVVTNGRFHDQVVAAVRAVLEI